jgi:GAF domain-containing protein
MLSRFKNFFKHPVFDDPDKTRRAQNLNTILNSLLIALFLWAWYPIFIQGGVQIVVAFTAIGIVVAMYILLRHGFVQLVGGLLTFLLWALVTGFMGAFGGVRNSGFATLAIIVVIASLTIGIRAGLIYAVLSILAGGAFVIAENRGWLPPYANEPNTTILVSYSLIIIAVGLLLALAIGNINKSLQISLSSEKKTKETIALLEQNRVELEQRSASLEQRNAILQLVAEISELSSQTQDQRTLLENTIKLLSAKLNVDHVGVFLVDDLHENAILSATNSEEGKSLLADGYKLRLRTSLANYFLLEGETLKYQIGSHTFLVSGPAPLSESKTNLTFPLATGERLVGLINFQTISPEPGKIEAETFQIVANQIALSLENIRLVEQLQSRLQEIGHLAGETTQTAWKRWTNRNAFGFQYDQMHILSKSEAFPEEVQAVLLAQKSTSYVTTEAKPRARLVAPIILRNNVIGVLGYEHNDPNHNWLKNEKTMLETISSRVSLALENSRLVAEAQERAERERIIGNITAKMRETLDMDTILRTAVNEMQLSFELQQAEIRLQSSPTESKEIHR